MKRKGFTLIELMLVVAIIGLLAAIALPKFANLVVKSREAVAKGQLGAIRSAFSLYYADNDGLYPGIISTNFIGQNNNPSLLDGKYLDKIPALRHPTRSDAGHNGNLVANWNGSSDGYSSWVYLVDGAGLPLGKIILNCDHTDTKATTWSSY